jgi:hypothetical protein
MRLALPRPERCIDDETTRSSRGARMRRGRPVAGLMPFDAGDFLRAIGDSFAGSPMANAEVTSRAG